MTDGIIRTDLDYLSLGEQRMFADARSAGKLSFFQIKACARCGVEIPNVDVKKYCTEKCSVMAKQEASDGESSEDGDGDGEVDR